MDSLNNLNAVITAIKNKTTTINESLEDLVDNIIKTREKISMNVPLYNPDYKNILIGSSLQIDPSKFTFSFQGNVEIDFNNFDIHYDFGDYTTDDTLIIKQEIDEYKAYLSNTFKSINSLTNIDCIYTSDLSFATKEIPNVKWFKNNFFTINTKSMKNDLLITRDDYKLADASIMTYETSIANAAINLLENSVDVSISDTVHLNGLVFTPSFIDGINYSELPISINNISIKNASNFNSVITNEFINDNFILKDLSNLKSIIIKSDLKNDYALLDIDNLNNALQNYEFLSGELVIDKEFQFSYISNPKIKQSAMSHIVGQFNETAGTDDNGDTIINKPNSYVSKLSSFGEGGENEPVTLSSINALVALIVHKNTNNTLIVTDKYYRNNIMKYKQEFLNIDERDFSVPIFTQKDNICTYNDLKNILN